MNSLNYSQSSIVDLLYSVIYKKKTSLQEMDVPTQISSFIQNRLEKKRRHSPRKKEHSAILSILIGSRAAKQLETHSYKFHREINEKAADWDLFMARDELKNYLLKNRYNIEMMKEHGEHSKITLQLKEGARLEIEYDNEDSVQQFLDWLLDKVPNTENDNKMEVDEDEDSSDESDESDDSGSKEFGLAMQTMDYEEIDTIEQKEEEDFSFGSKVAKKKKTTSKGKESDVDKKEVAYTPNTCSFPGGGTCYVPPVCFLFAIKHSHIYWPIHWRKSIADFHWLKNHPDFDENGWMELQKCFSTRLEETTDRLGSSNVNLNVSNEEFFGEGKKNTMKSVQRYVEHDSIHELVMYYTRPIFETLKTDKSKALLSRKLFEESTTEVKLNCVREEAMAIAIERFVIPHYVRIGQTPKLTSQEAYELALERVCTTLTSGWFRQFAIYNWPIINQVDKDLVAIYRKHLEPILLPRLLQTHFQSLSAVLEIPNIQATESSSTVRSTLGNYDILQRVPSDVFLKVFSFVPIGDLGRLSMTCSSLKSMISSSDMLWATIAQSTWKLDPCILMPVANSNTSQTWKTYSQDRYFLEQKRAKAFKSLSSMSSKLGSVSSQIQSLYNGVSLFTSFTNTHIMQSVDTANIGKSILANLREFADQYNSTLHEIQRTKENIYAQFMQAATKGPKELHTNREFPRDDDSSDSNSSNTDSSDDSEAPKRKKAPKKKLSKKKKSSNKKEKRIIPYLEPHEEKAVSHLCNSLYLETLYRNDNSDGESFGQKMVFRLFSRVSPLDIRIIVNEDYSDMGFSGSASYEISICIQTGAQEAEILSYTTSSCGDSWNSDATQTCKAAHINCLDFLGFKLRPLIFVDLLHYFSKCSAGSQGFSYNILEEGVKGLEDRSFENVWYPGSITHLGALWEKNAPGYPLYTILSQNRKISKLSLGAIYWPGLPGYFGDLFFDALAQNTAVTTLCVDISTMSLDHYEKFSSALERSCSIDTLIIQEYQPESKGRFKRYRYKYYDDQATEDIRPLEEIKDTTIKGIQMICRSLLRNNKIINLTVSTLPIKDWNPWQDETIAEVLSSCDTLQTLNNFPIRDIGRNKMTNFHSSHNSVTLVELLVLKKLLPSCPALKVLNFNFLFGPLDSEINFIPGAFPPRIRDHFGILIAILTNNPLITELHLDGQEIPKKGIIKLIQAAATHKSLQVLSLRGNCANISDINVEKLLGKTSKCTVLLEYDGNSAKCALEDYVNHLPIFAVPVNMDRIKKILQEDMDDVDKHQATIWLNVYNEQMQKEEEEEEKKEGKPSKKPTKKAAKKKAAKKY